MVSPLANGVRLSWERLIAGRSGIAQIQGFDPSDLPVKIAGEIPSGDDAGAFRPADIVPTKDLRKMDDFIVYALCAAVEAVEDSGWTPEDEESLERTGVMIGSGIGGLKTIEAATILVSQKGYRRLSPFFIPSSLINLASGHVSIRYGFRGPNHSVVTACSTGAHAIGDATHFILRGDADVMVAGGAEAGVCHLGVAGFRRGPRALHQFQRYAGARIPPVGRGARRVRDGRGRRRRGAGRVRAREGAGRHDLCRDHRLRHERRCPPRDRAGAGRLGRLPLHGARAQDRRAQHRRNRLHQRARDLDAARRRNRAGRRQAPLRRRRRSALDVVDQVVHRASARRGGQRGADLLHPRPSTTAWSRRRSISIIPRRAAISISSRTRLRSARSSARCPTPSDSAAPTPRSSCRPS
ncbi:3-oxoacyl-[acyl-carrier-protein] synthase 2 [Geodia barretti]|nr:3-oxoacyl-[acyl-carrier-protein] synthase 2 [Geodia barretti]